MPKTPTWRKMSFWADHRSPTFRELFTTKPVVTEGTNRYLMKDMDIGYYLFIDTLWIPVGPMDQKLQPVKVTHVNFLVHFFKRLSFNDRL